MAVGRQAGNQAGRQVVALLAKWARVDFAGHAHSHARAQARAEGIAGGASLAPDRERGGRKRAWLTGGGLTDGNPKRPGSARVTAVECPGTSISHRIPTPRVSAYALRAWSSGSV